MHPCRQENKVFDKARQSAMPSRRNIDPIQKSPERGKEGPQIAEGCEFERGDDDVERAKVRRDCNQIGLGAGDARQ